MNPELLKALGLPDDATEEEVVARAAEMAQELADLRTAAADAAEGEAAAIINAEESEAGAELTEEEKQDVKELLLENRERGRRYLRALVQNKGNKPAVAVQNVRRYAGKPAAVVTAAREQKSNLALCNARAAEIVKEMKNRGEKPVFAVAFAQAKRELKKK